MTFLLISFVAGLLTVIAPCILPLLPVIVGSSTSGRSKATPYVVVGSLAVSIIVFTYLLKVSTAFIHVPAEVWTYLSGGIVFLFGLTMFLPLVWDHIPGLNKLSIASNKLMGRGYQKKSFLGDVIIGAALGPVFSSCSPTYFLILASVLPASFVLGSLYLLAYIVGLSVVLLAISLLGQKFANKLTGLSDPESKWKRGLGVLFIILGLAIAFGYEKKLEASILNNGFFDITKIEQRLLERTDPTNPDDVLYDGKGDDATTDTKYENGVVGKIIDKIVNPVSKNHFKEIVNPAGFVNTGDKPIKIADYVGKKVILLDIMTYSCINCQRTFPYVVGWYEKYKDDGFIVIGIHTPEFAFEKDKENVAEAMKKFGITFPVVLDNDYGTWNAYGNRYWPRKYLIDIHGNVVYDHIGEGAYDEMEMKIKDALKDRAQVLGDEAKNLNGELVASRIPETSVNAKSPEIYFGSGRNQYLANGSAQRSGTQTLTLPNSYRLNLLYLSGTWNFVPEYAETVSDSKIVYKYNAGDVYMVAEADSLVDVEVWQDGRLVESAAAGADVNAQGKFTVKESRLYKIIHNATPGEHILELRINGAGLKAYTFTFG